MKRKFGCHVSCAGGFENAIKNATELGVNSIQLHPSPPQRWNVKPYATSYEADFNRMREQSEVEHVFFHAIYLINLASADGRKLDLAKKSLSYYLELSSRIKGDGVVVHVGSLKDFEDNPEQGFAQAVEAIDWVLDNSPEDSRLILEVAAGSGKIIGSRLEELSKIRNEVKSKDRIGYGLDTQHMWASGYDFQNNLDQIIKDIDQQFGFENVWIVHLNDSKTALASKKDRHENIGFGEIGRDALCSVLNHQKLMQIPFILETPALKSMDTAKQEVDQVKELLATQ